MGEFEGEKPDKNSPEKDENTAIEFSLQEIILLNLIAEIIINASIKEYYEKSNQVSKVQRQKTK